MDSLNLGSSFRSLYRSDPSVRNAALSRVTARRVWEFGKPYRKLLAATIAITALTAVIAVTIPILAGDVVNAIVESQARSVVVWIALAIAGLALFDAMFGLIGRWLSSRIGEGLIYDLRRSVFDHVLSMPIAFFTRTQTGALVSRLNNDVIGAQRAFTATVNTLTSNVLQLVFTAAAMAVLSWQITLLSLILLPLFIFPAKYVGRRLQRITREQQGLNASMHTTMTERFNVSGALLVKLFGRPEQESGSFSQRAGRVRDIGVRSSLLSGTFFVSLTLVAMLAQALVYGVGGWLALSNVLSAGAVVSLALLLTRLYGPLTALANVRVDVMSALVSFERVFEVLDLPPMIREKPDARPLPSSPRSVEFDRVSFAYPSAEEVSLASLEDVAVLDNAPKVPVLHEVSFSVSEGEMVALVGPSGAGKSTISALLSRVYDVDAGSVRINGVDVRDTTLASLRETVGVVTQDSHLFHDTIRANLLYAKPGASNVQLWEALRGAYIADLIERLPDGLDTLVGERGYRLSGGEKQRIAIARILLKAPRIVILDEATAHLDSSSEAIVQKALDAALEGRTAIVIAHRLSTVRDADKILVIEDGRVVERGTHAELLTQDGMYAELNGAPKEALPAG